jgi:membrane protein DedA with SNARE-associated domain
MIDPAKGRFVSAQEQARCAGYFAQHGLLVLAACRAVPVLAEASILAAGALRLPVRSVLLTTSAANLGVAGCYAALGASATDGPGFAVVLLASLALPAFALAISGRLHGTSFNASRITEALQEENRHVG